MEDEEDEDEEEDELEDEEDDEELPRCDKDMKLEAGASL